MRRPDLPDAAVDGAARFTASGVFGQASAVRVLRGVPQANLTRLDPIRATATITRTHAYLVYDTLLGLHSLFHPLPQMAQGWPIEDDGKVNTFTLRDGLRFHNGEKVTARDVGAPIQRWLARNGFGQEVAKRHAAHVVAVDDRHLRLTLQKPFALPMKANGKANALPCFVMPDSVAGTDTRTQITSELGSRPYRFVREGWSAGLRLVCARFDGYVPRREPTDGTAGAKLAKAGRMERHIIPDRATAGAALQSGQVEFSEIPLHDLLPVLRRNCNIELVVRDRTDSVGMLRFNHLVASFDNRALRRALMLTVDEENFLLAVVGDDRGMYATSHSFRSRSRPMQTKEGSEPLRVKSLDRARAALREAGYAGQRVVQITASDFPGLAGLSQVTADLLHRLDPTLEFVATDWGTVVQQRAWREPIELGGWNIFHKIWSGPAWVEPDSTPAMRANGTEALVRRADEQAHGGPARAMV